jgi:hypothetical protein
VWRRATRSLWCATLFRDIHTAVDAGNVLIWGNFRAKGKKFSYGNHFYGEFTERRYEKAGNAGFFVSFH